MNSGQRLIVVGAGGFGREVICWARDCATAGRLPRLGGFLDDQVEALLDYDIPRLGSTTEYEPRRDDLFLVAIGKPSLKRKVVDQLASRGASFATLIHPTAVVTATARLEEGVIVCPQAVVTADCLISSFVTINCLSSCGHDSRIGRFSTLSSHVDVTGNAVLGDEVFAGTGAKILPSVVVGEGAVIGAGATVYRSVGPGVTVYSLAAKTLRAPGSDSGA